VHNTSEIGVFKVLSETSSAANVRRIEAVTGPAAVTLLRQHDREITEVAQLLRVTPERVSHAVSELRGRVKELERELREGGGGAGVPDLDALAARAATVDSVHVLAAAVDVRDDKALLDLADRLKNKLGEAAIVLGRAGEDRVDLVVAVTPAVVARGVKAGQIVKVAAEQVGGGGGGRDTLARAGGKAPGRLPQAIDAARAAIEGALAS
jgi:alanyl-tRNA synthetase